MPPHDKHLSKIEKLKEQKQVLQKENRYLKSKVRDLEKSHQAWKAKAQYPCEEVQKALESIQEKDLQTKPQKGKKQTE